MCSLIKLQSRMSNRTLPLVTLRSFYEITKLRRLFFLHYDHFLAYKSYYVNHLTEYVTKSKHVKRCWESKPSDRPAPLVDKRPQKGIIPCTSVHFVTFLWISLKNTNLVVGVMTCFLSSSVQHLQRRGRKCLANLRPGQPSSFFVKFRQNPFNGWRNRKCLSQSLSNCYISSFVKFSSVIAEEIQ